MGWARIQAQGVGAGRYHAGAVLQRPVDLLSLAPLPPSHSHISSSVRRLGRHVRREAERVWVQGLWADGAWIDLITVMPVLLQNHFQIFMTCQLTSVDTLLGSGINSLQLGNNCSYNFKRE